MPDISKREVSGIQLSSLANVPISCQPPSTCCCTHLTVILMVAIMCICMPTFVVVYIQQLRVVDNFSMC